VGLKRKGRGPNQRCVGGEGVFWKGSKLRTTSTYTHHVHSVSGLPRCEHTHTKYKIFEKTENLAGNCSRHGLHLPVFATKKIGLLV
jgi:hypothetical protein